MKEHALSRRVVVTGLGVVAPNGNTVTESWQNIIAGNWHSPHYLV